MKLRYMAMTQKQKCNFLVKDNGFITTSLSKRQESLTSLMQSEGYVDNFFLTIKELLILITLQNDKLYQNSITPMFYVFLTKHEIPKVPQPLYSPI